MFKKADETQEEEEETEAVAGEEEAKEPKYNKLITPGMKKKTCFEISLNATLFRYNN